MYFTKVLLFCNWDRTVVSLRFDTFPNEFLVEVVKSAGAIISRRVCNLPRRNRCISFRKPAWGALNDPDGVARLEAADIALPRPPSPAKI